MEEFEPSSDAWNRKLMSSSQIPMLGIGNGSSRLGIGNVGVQTMFVAWNRKWRSLSQFRSLESEMEEFE